MRPVYLTAALVVTLCLTSSGCNQGELPKVQKVEAPVSDPLVEAKTILNNYANGMPVTSEAESFPELIARVKEKDAAKGAILEKGLTEIKANPSTAKAKATELLKQL
jgi:hypothetical protein